MGCISTKLIASPPPRKEVEQPIVDGKQNEGKNVDLEQLRYENTTSFLPRFTSGKIVKVYDADTFWIATYCNGVPARFRLRLAGVDTPEIKSKDPQIKAKAIFARDQVRARILNRIVQVEILPEIEKFGRLLARVSDSMGSINDWLISSGMAKPYFGGTKESFEE